MLGSFSLGYFGCLTVTMTPQFDTAPEGCQGQTFSIPRGEDSKKFLRLQTTLPAEPQR